MPDRLRPEQHIRADIVVPFDRETTADIGNRLGLSGKSWEPFRNALAVHGCPSQAGGE